MATLTIRNLPDEVHDALRRRAAEHRRSMEAEARELISVSVLASQVSPKQAQALAELREMGRAWRARQTVPADWDGTDAFVAERHLEAAWEDGRVTDTERQALMDRLETYDVRPEEIEAFLETRRPDLP